MHKGVILLVLATDRDEAKNKAEAFLVPYDQNGDAESGGVWDWYQIGGRWSGALTEYDPAKDPKNIVQCEQCGGTGIRSDSIGRINGMTERVIDTEGHPRFGQTGWCNGCDGKGQKATWPTQWEETVYDVMPCTDARVATKVAEWSKGWKDSVMAELEELKGKFSSDSNMTDYANRKQRRIEADEFTFDSNVFDCERRTNEAPANLAGYWAVIVDMHV